MGFLIWLIVSVLTLLPMQKLLPHFGMPKVWAFGCFIPFGALALLWMMAMKLQEMDRR